MKRETPFHDPCSWCRTLSMARLPQPAEGCYTAEFPRVEWKKVEHEVREAHLRGLSAAMVDEVDHDLTARWERAGLTVRRREREYLVPVDPLITGLHTALAPSDVTILGLGTAREPALRDDLLGSLRHPRASAGTRGPPGSQWRRGTRSCRGPASTVAPTRRREE